MNKIEVGDLLRLHGGRIDRVVKIIPPNSWDYERYETVELLPAADTIPKRGLLYARKKSDGISDAVLISKANKPTVHDQLSTVVCYDNGGSTADRYAAVFTDHPYGVDSCFNSYSMSDAPCHPQGEGMFGAAQPGPHLGKVIDFNELPEDCQQLVLLCLQDDDREMQSISQMDSSSLFDPIGAVSSPYQGH